MAPEIMDSSPPGNGKLTVKVMTETSSSIESTDFKSLRADFAPLFNQNNIAKILSVAEAYLGDNESPTNFPETVPQAGSNQGIYQCRNASFWTCGFFPGSLYSLLERLRKYPATSNSGDFSTLFNQNLITHLTDLCRKWSAPLNAMSFRKDTHDLGFIVQPALQRDWELFGRQESLESLLNAAQSLASRYDAHVGAVRSWDSFSNAHHNITSMEDDFLVIIDSLCNLDLLFYAGNYTQNPHLISIASTHATTLLSTHLRKETIPTKETCYSTYHAANLSPRTGSVKRKLTAQGYSDDSTWARGQAWAILGYAQAYSWTKERKFLDAAIGLAEYFVHRLETSPNVVEEDGRGRYVPLWDFDAPITYTTVDGKQAPLRDVSAGLITANGMLIMFGQLSGTGEYESAKRYLDYALLIAKDTIALAYNRDEMRLGLDETGGILVEKVNGNRFDAILGRSTANFNANHADRHWDHGLVYADYYFLEFGNRLLDMGLI
ncbi:Six-hairpin glycosidase-like protein [Penicillium lagena]|uniref:Six-hairpin glycosidase-like protein n=1 Tax=Penicillium lagena TaxID=94218 RepID=UPI0025412F59|nr:Six-hairpin glycosidase-like protein [Penicillium lagena]KAJ5606074.1 Six-hairpin glycosidase-like protein [Penicillium lagena]